MKKRLLALLLVLALCLAMTACSAPAADETDTGAAETNTNTGTDTESIEADLSQDIISFAMEGVDLSEPLLTVNGVAVPNALMLYWLAFNCSYFESYYGYYGLTVKDYAEFLKEDSISMGSYYALLDIQADANGCPLTDDQMAAITEAMDKESEEYQQRMDLYGFTEEELLFIYSMEDLYSNLMEALVPAPTEEDLNNYVYQVKHILISTVDMDAEGSYDDDGNYVYAPLDEETLAAQTALAQDLLAQLQACQTQEELETLFDSLMNEYSEDGRDEDGALYAPDGYTAVLGEMVSEFEEAALALEFGELSGLVKTPYGYHIILRGEVEKLEDYSEDCRTAATDKLMDQWLEDAEIVRSEALENLDLPTVYARYLAWQDAYIEAHPVESDDATETE